MLNRRLALIFFCLSLANCAWSKVLVRWTEPVLPKASLGISELVIPWGPNANTLMQAASKAGYRVYAEVPIQTASEAAEGLIRQQIAGVILDGNIQEADRTGAKLQATYPNLKCLLLLEGKQPQMRGQTVTTSKGVLQVSSATAQPWLDSNLAMVRFHRATHRDETPLYSFSWELNDSLQQQYGPTADDYALAIAEAGALSADLVLPLHAALQKGLVDNEPAAWNTWKKLVPFFRFASSEQLRSAQPWSNVGVIAPDYDAAYEPMNLMARHNIPFRVIKGPLSAGALDHVSVVVVFTVPDQQTTTELNSFAGQGGTVVMVDAKGKFPWQSPAAVQTAEHAVSYAVGRGKVFELTEPVSDPETFAEDVRRLIPKQDALISLWNALTTIAVPYRESNGELTMNLVNYAEEAMRIQIEVKGSFSAIRYETPEDGCCKVIAPVKHDGFTDFVVPRLVIAGRVHLQAARVADAHAQK